MAIVNGGRGLDFLPAAVYKSDGMKKTKASRNRIQKTTPVFLWISALFRPGILFGLLKTFVKIFSKFFFLQFQTVIFPKTRPVINVDHPLDNNIPFDPSWVGLYNTFTAFWMKAAGWILKNFGIAAADDVARFTNDIALLYSSAGEVYEKCQSTTNRPSVTASLNFIIIHIFDPHLHCVPSLHVMVCAYTAYMTSELIEKYAYEPEEYRAEIDWIYKNALEIIESVLLVKQHSVNCIPAGYYMNSILFDDFRKKWAGRFIEDMFNDDAKGIKEVKDVKQHINLWYERFIKDYDTSGNRSDVLINFLKTYDGVKLG